MGFSAISHGNHTFVLCYFGLKTIFQYCINLFLLWSNKINVFLYFNNIIVMVLTCKRQKLPLERNIFIINLQSQFIELFVNYLLDKAHCDLDVISST